MFITDKTEWRRYRPWKMHTYIHVFQLWYRWTVFLLRHRKQKLELLRKHARSILSGNIRMKVNPERMPSIVLPLRRWWRIFGARRTTFVMFLFLSFPVLPEIPVTPQSTFRSFQAMELVFWGSRTGSTLQPLPARWLQILWELSRKSSLRTFMNRRLPVDSKKPETVSGMERRPRLDILWRIKS